jgi:hypothetical protein
MFSSHAFTDNFVPPDYVLVGVLQRRFLYSCTGAELPGGPCVLVSCHPTKNADRDNLLPRGGGAYVAEVDGNLICRKAGGDNVSEIHWHGKFRGPDFNPLAFETRQVSSAKLVDSDGQPIPTVIGFPLDEAAHSNKRAESRAQEDDLLQILSEHEGLSLASMAQLATWINKAGEPHKSKAARVIERLRLAGLVKNERGDWRLTETGRKAAARTKERREGANRWYNRE